MKIQNDAKWSVRIIISVSLMIWIAVFGSGCGPQGDDPDGRQREQLAELQTTDLLTYIEETYYLILSRYPETVTSFGLDSLMGLSGAELNNLSESYRRETLLLCQEVQQGLARFDRSRISGENRLTLQVYERFLAAEIDGLTTILWTYPVNPSVTGFYFDLHNFFTELQPLANRRDAENYLIRLSRVEDKVDQIIAIMKEQKKAGRILPSILLNQSLNPIRTLAYAGPRQNDFFRTFKLKTGQMGMSDSEYQALLERAETLCGNSFIPSIKKLMDYLNTLKSESPDSLGLIRYEGGEEYYQNRLDHYTTTQLTAEEIHQTGLRELQSLTERSRILAAEMNLESDGTLKGIFQALDKTGPHIASSDMVQAHQDLVMKANGILPRLFNQQPRAQVRIKGVQFGGYYIPPSTDGTRPGTFYASEGQGSPAYQLPTLTFHETVPGHHFQIALAGELELPLFRKLTTFTAYAEGWALYAEELMAESGFYHNDPAGELGMIQAQAFRAARLVVDTGIHAYGWDFAKAVAFFTEHTGFTERMAQGQIIRYASWPGQACSYMVGKLKIRELRALAEKAENGESAGTEGSFNLPEFHQIILESGSLPLDLLEQKVRSVYEK